MEGNMSSQGGNFPGGAPYGGLDLQRSMQIHHQAQPHHAFHHSHSRGTQPSIPEGFPLTTGTFPTCDQTVGMGDLNKGERGRNSASDEDDRSLNEDSFDNCADTSKGKKGSPWQRVKWTDKMVRQLITAVSYIGEDAASECGASGGRKKSAILQRKGKWKSVSKVLAERGFHVSPQQCEDKFNDLNKRYKKLNDMLGRGTSCSVVENPALLDVLDFLSDKEKDDVRKILSSKHLFYEEMCSYHNGNRLHLPHDPELQHSLQLALKSRENNEMRRHRDDFEDHDGDDPDVEHDDHDEYGENSHGVYGGTRGHVKRMKLGHADDDIVYGINSQEGHKSSHLHPHTLQQQPDINLAAPGNSRAPSQQKPQVESQSKELEEQKLQIQIEMFELEKQKFKWERFCRKKDRELEKVRLENEKMKLENERLALELKHKEMAGGYD